ncbi:hypothetical protein JNM87_00665 [Candidatus Saccharibacteria bacterium]|nr:hypothetical protein [Candidatus Saccharibacteria bacterium]
MKISKANGFAAVTAAVGLSLFPSAAEATVGDRCGAVYLEGETQIAPELTGAIGALALKGVDMHVHLLKGADGYNMATDQGFDRYVKKTVRDCRWGDTDVLVTYVDYTAKERARYGVNNGVLDINRSNAAERTWLPEDVAAHVRKNFGAALSDKNSGIQSDLTVVVGGLHTAYDVMGYPHEEPSSTPNAASDKREAVDIPWGQLGKVGAPILALGGLGGFGVVSLRRRQEFTGTRAQLVGDIDAAIAKMLSVREGESYIAGQTNADDSGLDGLRSEGGDLARLSVEFRAAREAVAGVPLSLVWPKPGSLDGVATTVRRLQTQFVPEVAEYVAAREAAEQDLAQAEGRMQKLQELLQQAYSAKGSLAEDGWDVAVLETRYADLYAQVGTLAERRQQQAIAASDYAEKLIPQVAKYVADTSAAVLKARFNEAITAHEVRADTIKTVAAEITTAKQVFEAISNGLKDGSSEAYDSSCYEDIKVVTANIDSLFEQMSAIQEQAKECTGQKSVAAIETAEKLRDDFTRTVLAARQEMQRVHDRRALLEELKVSLPNDTYSLQQLLTQHIGDAEEWGGDIDAAAKEALSDTQTHMDELKLDLAARRPKYLAIRDSYAAATEAIAEAYKQVTEQRAEATSLRSSIGEEWADVEASLRALQDYVSSNPGDTLGISTGFVVSAPNTSGTRAKLRASLSQLQAIDQQIDGRLREAKEQVRRAEAAREAKRLRVEAERRARSSSSTSLSRSSSSGRSSSRGGV